MEKLRIEVEWYHTPWLRALPLDPSQEELVTEDYSVFSYHMNITPDVIERLRLIADFIDVLEPEWVKEKIEETNSAEQ